MRAWADAQCIDSARKGGVVEMRLRTDMGANTTVSRMILLSPVESAAHPQPVDHLSVTYCDRPGENLTHDCEWLRDISGGLAFLIWLRPFRPLCCCITLGTFHI
jgi:hypothetical protein